MHEHECVDAALCDQPGGDDCLAERRRRGQNASLVAQHRVRRRLLLRPELALKGHVQRSAVATLVTNDRANVQDRSSVLRTSSRQPRGRPMCCGMIFGARDDARLVVGGQAAWPALCRTRDSETPPAEATGSEVPEAGRPWRCRSRCRERVPTSSGKSPTIGGSFRRRDGGAVHGSVSPSSCGGRRTPRTRPRRSASSTSSSTCVSPILRTLARNAHWSAYGTAVIQEDAVALLAWPPSAAAGRSDCRILRAATCLDSERGDRTNQSRCPAGAPSFRSGRCEPSLRASAAGMASSKKNQTCPPRPERDRSSAAGRFRRRHVFEKGRCILAPAGLVEIDGQEEARLVLKHRIDAGDKRLALGVAARQVPTNHFVSHRKESTVGTVGAFDARLLADASHPLVGAGGRVTGLAGFPALESPRINIVATAEQRTEQRDLGLRRRCLIDRARDQVHELLSLQPPVEDRVQERLVEIEAGRLESFEQIGHVHQALLGT